MTQLTDAQLGDRRGCIVLRWRSLLTTRELFVQPSEPGRHPLKSSSVRRSLLTVSPVLAVITISHILQYIMEGLSMSSVDSPSWASAMVRGVGKGR